jgi:hypothetical protein
MRSHQAALPLLTSLACLLGASRAEGQCKDWSHLFSLDDHGLNGDVHDLIVHDDGSGPRLYAAGEFTMAGGVPAAHVASWNGVQWAPLGSGLNGEALALEVHGGDLYVGGFFTMAGGIPAARIARWDGFAWSAVGQGFNFTVLDLKSHDDGSGFKLFAGGQFTQADFAPAAHVAAWDGVNWSQVGAGMDGDVRSLGRYNEGSGVRLFAGGDFVASGATPVKVIGRWDGASWSEVGGGIGGSGSTAVLSLEVFNDGSGAGTRLWVGGDFDNAGGVPRANLAAWNGTAWSGPAATPNGPVFALEGFNDGLVSYLAVGGDFDAVGAMPVQHIAAWSGFAWNSLSTGLTPEINEPVCRVLLGFNDGAGPRLFAGGGFKSAGGKPSSRIARWNDACSPVVIVEQPTDQIAVFDDPVAFDVEAHGTAPVTYQWRHDGVNLVDAPGVEGTQTDALRLYVWSYSDKGQYDVVITNPFGSVTSATAVLTVPAGGLSGSPVEVTTVLHPPEIPDNSPGDTFTAFYSPLQCPTEEMLFIGVLNGGPQSLSRWDSGTTEVLFRPGDPAPGLPAGLTLGSNQAGTAPFGQFVAGPGGSATFLCDIYGPGVQLNDNEGIWYFDGSTAHLVVREGDQAAGLPAGVVYRDLLPARMSDTGLVVFSSPTYSGASFVTMGVWSWSVANGLTLVAKIGDPAPGTSTHFTSFLGNQPLLTPSGELLLQAQLDTITGFNYGGAKDTGLWKGAPAALSLVAKSGDPAPGMPAGSNLEFFKTDEGFSDDLGRVVFTSFVAGPSGFYKLGLFLWQAGTLTPVAVYGQQAPGAALGTVFFAPRVMALGGPDMIVFASNLQNFCTPCANDGLWASIGGTVHPILLDDPGWLVGTPDDFLLSDVVAAAADGDGNVVFECTLQGAGSIYRGVFGWSLATGLYPIAVPGTQIEIAPDVFRMVVDGFLPAVGGSAGIPYSRNLSLTGTLGFQANFSDGTQAVAQGNLALFKSLEFGSGTPYCFGDSTGTACPCGNEGAAGAGCINSSGEGAVLSATGSILVSDDELRFHGSGLPKTTVALLIEGSGQAAGGQGLPFGDGLLCVGGTVVRIQGKLTSPTGTIEYGPGLASLGGWDGGETWNFQVWYRDVPGVCGVGYNLSNAYQVSFLP